MDTKIKEYITESIAQGKSKEEIYMHLLHQQYTVDAIQASFYLITSVQEKDDTHKRTIRIIVTIAAILVGAGVFSLIASNWEEMPKVMKVIVILFSMINAYGFGWYYKEKRGFTKTGDALILLGALIYGGGIFLVGQIFNIRAHWPDGFILWMLGVIAMAYAADAFILFHLAIPVGVIAIIGNPVEIFTGSPNTLFLLTSSLLVMLATGVTFFIGWDMRRKMAANKL